MKIVYAIVVHLGYQRLIVGFGGTYMDIYKYIHIYVYI